MVSVVGPEAAGARFAGVRVRDDARAVTKVNLPAEAFTSENDRANEPGNHSIPGWVAAYGTAAQPLYAGVWEKNTILTSWSCHNGVESASVRRITDAFTLERLRPSLVTPAPGGRYTGSGADDPLGGQLDFQDLSSAQYQAKLDQRPPRGFLPVRVQAPGTNPGAVFAAISARRDTPLPRRFSITGRD